MMRLFIFGFSLDSFMFVDAGRCMGQNIRRSRCAFGENLGMGQKDVFEHLESGPLVGDLAVFQNIDLVGDFPGQVNVMGNEEHGKSVGVLLGLELPQNHGPGWRGPAWR